MWTRIHFMARTGRPYLSTNLTLGLRPTLAPVSPVPSQILTYIDSAPYRSVTIKRLPTSTLDSPSPLQSSRAYSIDISPRLLYCSSELTSCLADTKLSQYLEFKAIDHIFMLHQTQGVPVLQKVPSSREDVFTSPLSLQEKRKLMRFLNYALLTNNYSNLFSINTLILLDLKGSLGDLLASEEYNLPVSLRNTIQFAIALSPTPEISANEGLKAIQRHLKSFGVYGSFPILVPLYGGGGELSQAFCRSAAVKGAVYILGRGIKEVNITERADFPVQVDFDVSSGEELPRVQSKSIVRLSVPSTVDCIEITKTVTVIEGGLGSLFAEGSQHTDAALIVIPPCVVGENQNHPIQVIVHSGST